MLDRAPLLLGQGRWKTLLESIALFPNAEVTDSASLLYWRGMAYIAVQPLMARTDLEAALQIYKQECDAIGQLLAIVGIISSHFVQDDSIASYSRWIDPMAALFAQTNDWPNPTIELEARSMFLLAASHLRPEHNLLLSTSLSVARLMEDDQIDSNTRAAAGVRALVYFMWTGETESARRINEHLELLFIASDVLPVHVAMGYAFRAYYQHLTLVDSDAALLSVGRALEIAQDNGLQDVESLAWQFQAMVGSAFGWDLDLAEIALQRIANLGFKGNLNRGSNYYGTLAWVCKWRGDTLGALLNLRLCISAARANCPAFRIFVCYGAELFADAGEFEEATHLVQETRELIAGTCFDNFGAMLTLGEAYIALCKKESLLCHDRLYKGVRMAKTNPRHLAVLHYSGASLPKLFAESLTHNIESDYIGELIVRWKVPAPDNAPANWPWPLSVHTLGKFVVTLHGKPIEFGRKTPRKTLALLKALIALGSTNVPEQTLVDALWPDEDGDAGHGAYSMALSRLRKLLGDNDLLQQQGGKLSLDRRKCWVDAWVFERSVNDIGAAMGKSLLTDLAPALALYIGNFLPEDTDATLGCLVTGALALTFYRLYFRRGQHPRGCWPTRRSYQALPTRSRCRQSGRGVLSRSDALPCRGRPPNRIHRNLSEIEATLVDHP